MVHRALFGSLERFVGALIEQYKGAFPVWLAPVQAVVIPVSEKFLDYAESVRGALAAGGIRAETDRRNEKMGLKIRDAQLQRVPYMLIVGGRERDAGAVAVRSREAGDQGAMPLAGFISMIQTEAKEG
jgi:threonyl-tRNA synthetase